MSLHFNNIISYAMGIYSYSESMIRPMLRMRSPSRNERNENRGRLAETAFRNFYAAYRVSSYSECAYASVVKAANKNLSIEVQQTIK